ncbi:LOW QUALITY PROTEIN: toll-like receptor 4 [Elgaria multicarinata webbii]|uniref:LOW QUALITY PROTEIN: toll-like receptor 4 n=1 Tax=Elgaria multicarinata webbii TaxID=159646 RepID=UPI002FCD1132
MPRSGDLCPPVFIIFSWAVLFWSRLITQSLNPCLEVVPGTTYRCMELNLSRIPPDIPNTVQSLDLSFNPLKSLAANMFSSVFALRFLDLTRCHIQKIEDNAFEGLCNLSVLILTGNPLQFLGPRAFHDLTSLQRLIAVEINLFSLDRLAIGHLKSLQELNLSNNYIDSLKLPEYFSRFLFLRWLSLQSNNISSILVGDLDALSGRNLTLVLSNNNIKFIEVNALARVYLQRLSLRSCFENNAIMKACLWNLSGSHVNSLVLGEYRNIEKLETFSKDLLDGLCNAHLQEITLNSFGDDLSDTNSLSDCLNNIPTVRLLNSYIEHVSSFPANSNIRRLEFENCKLRSVPAENLSSLKELRVLRITRSHRKLTGLQEAFKGLHYLETLDLSENSIRDLLCWNCFTDEVPNLKRLNLSFNSRINLPAECSGISKLEYLDFQHTSLLDPGKVPGFLCLANLIYLDISHTSTKIMIECPFCGLDNLQVLKMAGNTFQNNQLFNNFQNLAKLQILDISSCQLQHIPPSSLAHLHELRELNVSRNKLLGLHSEIFGSLHALTTLDFHSNQLAALTEDNLKNLSRSLKNMDLSHNLFYCSCDHLNFLRWAKEHKALLQHTENMVCHGPVHLKDVHLMSFDLSSCQVSTTTVAVSVSISLVLVLSLFLVYKYYFHLYYMMILLSGDRLPSKKDCSYDAFVIYSSEDQEWVKQELQETLEKGVPRFRLCLFYRDFLPGVSIITNIIKEGFQSSRKVIAVVSSHFLESRWCNFELEVAQSWQLLDSKASLVLIVLEGVDKAVVQQKLGLFRYLRRNTYLVWKDRELNRHMFLRQLKVALLEGKTWNEEDLELMLNN